MKKKITKKITLNEFRAWLEGIEELQPNDWSPSKEQWKLIRNKIDYIEECVAPVNIPAQSIPIAPQPQVPVQLASSLLTNYREAKQRSPLVAQPITAVAQPSGEVDKDDGLMSVKPTLGMQTGTSTFE